MRDETGILLEAMQSWPWFEHVGEPIDNPGVMAVGSWADAVDPERSFIWECVTLQVSNRFSYDLRKRNWHRAQMWNPLVDEFKRILKPLFERIGALGARLSLPEGAFYHQVQWDIVGICLETEYADIYSPLFNVPILVPWYQAGHFPCGWDGPELSEGWSGELPRYHLYVF